MFILSCSFSHHRPAYQHLLPNTRTRNLMIAGNLGVYIPPTSIEKRRNSEYAPEYQLSFMDCLGRIARTGNIIVGASACFITEASSRSPAIICDMATDIFMETLMGQGIPTDTFVCPLATWMTANFIRRCVRLRQHRAQPPPLQLP